MSQSTCIDFVIKTVKKVRLSRPKMRGGIINNFAKTRILHMEDVCVV